MLKVSERPSPRCIGDIEGKHRWEWRIGMAVCSRCDEAVKLTALPIGAAISTPYLEGPTSL